MKGRNRKSTGRNWIVTGVFFIIFILWTVVIQVADVQRIGPRNSAVGLASLNGWFHELTGVHMLLYTITDWLGLVPLLTVAGFGIYGAFQLMKRKSLCKVDSDILVLGGFYLIVMAAYVLFEIFPVNYRPVLIEGVLEASYPSSTTLLVMCVMPTAVLQLNTAVHKQSIRRFLQIIIISFTGFMVIGRMISGVHWLTDIIGGIVLSAALCMLYSSVIKMLDSRKDLSC